MGRAPDDDPQAAEPTMLSKADVRRVIRRATELDSARDSGISSQELIEIARELGVSTGAVSQALQESRRIAPDIADPLSLYEGAAEVLHDARGPGWIARTIRRGVLVGLGVGVPVGLLIAFTTPSTDLPFGGRVGGVLVFIAITMAWAIPFSFGARWLALRSVGRREPL